MPAPQVLYSVIATLPDEATAREYTAWLRAGHVDAVVRAGAASGIIVRLTDPSASAPRRIRIMTQYVFPTRPAFDRYIAQVAPTLRAEGLARFGPDRAVTFERLVGDII